MAVSTYKSLKNDTMSSKCVRKTLFDGNQIVQKMQIVQTPTKTGIQNVPGRTGETKLRKL